MHRKGDSDMMLAHADTILSLGESWILGQVVRPETP